MEGRTVVVVEDDDHNADLVALYLGRAGFRVAQAGRADEGLALVAEHRPALAVVDIGLPGGVDGLELCRRLRRDSGVPILVLTARGDETDRVVGLELGADDYVTKPFSPRELVARIRAILRRSDGTPDGGTVVVGDVEVDLARHEARRKGRAVSLAPREFALLAALAGNRGIVLSRRQLLDLAWGYDWYGDERTVDVHVRQLRRKLGDGLPLATVKRTGYRLG
jgi:DNA-binding response OmpR family regulator